MKSGYISTQNKNNIKAIKKNKSGYDSNIYKDGNITIIESKTTIKNDEVKKPLLSYQEQMKANKEYNRLAVLNYNLRYG